MFTRPGVMRHPVASTTSAPSRIDARRGALGDGRDAPLLDHDMTVAVLGADGIDGRDVAAVEDDAAHSSSSTAVSSAASMLRIQPSLSAEFFSS